MNPIKVAIVEDHAETREALTTILNQADGFQCVGTFATGETAVKEIPSRKPDVVLVDLRLPKMSGIECIRELREKGSTSKILVLTVEMDPDHIFAAIAAGANGYLVKRKSIHRVPEAIREIHRGESPLSGSVARLILERFKEIGQPQRDDQNLSPRESQSLARIFHKF